MLNINDKQRGNEETADGSGKPSTTDQMVRQVEIRRNRQTSEIELEIVPKSKGYGSGFDFTAGSNGIDADPPS